LREEAQIDRAALADVLNKVDGRNGGDTYGTGLLTVEDIRRMEQNRIHGSFLLRVRALLKGLTT